MSWNFRKAGKDKEALRAAVQAENAPQAVKNHICDHIEAVDLKPGQVIVVMSGGHHEAPAAQPSWGETHEKTTVHVFPFIDTPLGS